eukprot:4600645-Pleurochrysis_carterae.AAC.2
MAGNGSCESKISGLLSKHGANPLRGSESPSKFGPEGLNLEGHPFLFFLGWVFWCSTLVLGSESRPAARPEGLATSRALINACSRACSGSL